MAKEDIKSYSMAELKAMRTRGETYTRPDAPEYELDEDFWRNARVVMPLDPLPNDFSNNVFYITSVSNAAG